MVDVDARGGQQCLNRLGVTLLRCCHQGCGAIPLQGDGKGEQINDALYIETELEVDKGGGR